MTFTGASANVVFDKSDTALEFNDDAKAVFGNSGDMEILHSGGVNQILSGGANIKLGTTGETYALFQNNSGVELYCDNEKMFQTNGDGSEFFDSDSNLNIYFTTNDTTRRGYIFVESTNGGRISLYDSQDHPMLSATKNDSVLLYYDNSPILETSASGVTVTGAVTDSKGSHSSWSN